MNCAHCLKPVEETEFGYWSLTEVGGYVALHAGTCKENFNRSLLVVDADIEVIPEIKVQHLRLLTPLPKGKK